MNDTICAISTSQGVGAIAIVRVSGEESTTIVNKIFKGKDLTKVDYRHMASMNPWIILNDHLSLDDIKKYFNYIIRS